MAKRRIARKTMPHKLKAKKDKTKAYRGSSIILLPVDWAMLRVAKLLHCFAPRYVQRRAIELLADSKGIIVACRFRADVRWRAL